MVVRSLDPQKDQFRESDEEILGPEVPYLNAIGALMYLAQCTRPDITFAVNLLARFSSEPTRRHWNGIKHIFRYLRGTIDLGLYYSKESTTSGLVGYSTLDIDLIHIKLALKLVIYFIIMASPFLGVLQSNR